MTLSSSYKVPGTGSCECICNFIERLFCLLNYSLSSVFYPVKLLGYTAYIKSSFSKEVYRISI